MKAIYPKFAALSFAAILFAACSDSTSDGGSNNGNNGSNTTTTDLTTLNLTEQQLDLSRVSNYKSIISKAVSGLYTRAGQTDFVTEMPATPDDSKALGMNTAVSMNGKTYCTAKKQVYDFSGKTVENSTIFVKSGSTFQYDNSTTLTNTTIVLVDDGKLNYTGTGAMVPEGCTVYCTEPNSEAVTVKNDIIINGNFYAKFRGTSDNGTALSTGLGAIKETTTAEKKISITPTQNITFGSTAKVYVNGSIRAKVLKVEEGANVYATNNLFNAYSETAAENEQTEKKGEATIAGNLQLSDGFIKSATLNVTGNLIVGAGVKVTNAFNVNDGAVVKASYINVTDNTKDGDTKVKDGDATLSLNGTGKIVIGHKNVIVANNLVTDNSNAGQITLNDESGSGAVAVIKADVFKNTGSSTEIKTFSAPATNSAYLFQFTNSFNGDTKLATFEDLDLATTYFDYDKATKGKDVKLVNEKNKKYGYEWTGDIEALQNSYKLDLVAAESTPQDGQSASCIQPANGKIYVGYHTYGDKKVGGNIEQLSISGNQLTLEKSMKAADIDYNHLMVDGNYLYLAGSQQRTEASTTKAIGAFLGQVALTSGALGNQINLYSVNATNTGVDANCVAKYGDNYVVATTKGFTVMDKDFNFQSYAGDEGKYVVTSGNTLYTLNLASSNNLNSYTSADLTTAAGSWSTSSAITPDDNKAVMAIDGNVMYVCKGENGIDKVDLKTGTVTQFWTCPTFVAHNATNLENEKEYVKGHCNGIAVKGDFIYVAHGSYGLVVLNKSGEMVCHRKAFTGKSANFVAVDDNGYIYVAYGQSRVQVFKLTGVNK